MPEATDANPWLPMHASRVARSVNAELGTTSKSLLCRTNPKLARRYTAGWASWDKPKVERENKL